ncbi:hypothetical protein [Streptomyces sp. NBC_00691]|uniref:hypothetical protein n=1 Tax=Streptomyces sp. NBC_00691 TaxID=2903671 RepID=UPI002E338FAB|nr:hypothetical protein [Streptomyces sp. NBC_00691]
MRHVRAIAVFGIAVVALTGARGSHGGSCGGSSSSGSSSSSNHNSDNDSTSGGTSGGSLPGGSSSADKAIRDVTINECAYDAATKNLVARVTVKNDGALDYDYSVTMKFTGDTGGTASPATATKTAIAVAAGASVKAELATSYPGTGDGSEYTKCEVTRASRS